MTSPTPRRKPIAILALLSCCIALTGAAGCGKKKKAPPPPPPPPPPRVETPKPVDVKAVMQELKADERVKFAEEQSPADRTLAEGVIKLAHAMARGDQASMKTLLDRPSQLILDELVSNGGWAEETKSIEQVRIVSMTGTTEAQPTTSTVGMAIQAPGDAYLLAWTGKRDGDKWVFSAAPCQNDKKPRAAEFDGVSISTSMIAPEDTNFTRPGTAAPGKTPDAPAGKEDTRDPSRKNTPGGPIKIPGVG